MILLFLVVWAIVIALNEVLFSAQPFTLTSLADTMPSTLVLSVFLSAAVYLAKKKIIDALKKGQPIDKRFVAELTPQVGHELNNVRRQMEGTDTEDSIPYENQGNVRRSTSKSRRKVNPYTAAVEAARTPHNKARREAYQRAYGDRGRHNLDDPNLKRAQEGLEALDALGSLSEDSGAEVPLTPRRRSDANRERSSNTYGMSAHMKAVEKAASGHSAATQHPFSSTGASVKGPRVTSGPTMAERKAQIEQNKEQLKQRRREQIEALSTVSQEDKAKAAVEQKNAAAQKKQRQKERQEQEAKAKAQAHKEFKQLKESLNPFAKKDAVKSKLGEKSKAAEQAAAEQAAAEKAAAEKAATEQAAMQAASEQARAQAEAQLKQSQAAAKQSQKVVRETRTAAPRKKPSDLLQSKQASSLAERAAQQQNLERLQQEAKRNVSSQHVPMGADDEARVPDYVDSLEIPGKGNLQLDTSGLQRTRKPKQGAGLDTSALKKAKLSPAINANMQRSAATFKPQQVDVGGGSGAGGRMLSTSAKDHAGAGNSMLQRTGEVGVNQPQQGSSGMSVRDTAAAMSTTLSNDSSLERGKTKRLDLADYQANARARALARAQAPKATHGWQGNAPTAKKHRADTTASSARKHTSAEQGRVGTASTLGMNNARAGLPTQMISSDEAPVRQVISTSLKPQVGPHSDNLPKVRPSDPISDLQLAPKIRARAKSNIKRNRDKLLQRGPNFINAAATAAAKGTVGSTSNAALSSRNAATNAQTDKIHAQNQANTYQMQQEAADQGAAQGKAQSKGANAKTPTDEQA
ncbi:MAG TPA: hypothetical protein H9850_04150 [Candidatus Anaerobiospirillum pullistercoris]|uniref:Uncharacterized protein n=1 Tax=Candidatus Anaerobiospirillum pullistercoris TaxID=2838452 RepID=A0A9D2B0G8_9GAMM|nr:hypothetical protein [Candidatus Anaerobiospirillum pullistercoris]